MESDIRQVYLLDFGNKLGYVGSAKNPYKRYYQHLAGQSGVGQVIEAIANLIPSLPKFRILDKFDNSQHINLNGAISIIIQLEQIYMWNYIAKNWTLLNRNLWNFPIEQTQETERKRIKAIKQSYANGRIPSQKGKKLSEETKKKISQANTGRKRTKEQKMRMGKAISKARQGMKFSEKHKAALSKAHKGKKMSSKGIAKLIGNQYAKGRKNSKSHQLALITGYRKYCCKKFHADHLRVSNSKLCKECLNKAIAKGLSKEDFRVKE